MAHNRGGDPEPRYPKPLNLDGFKNFEGLSPEPHVWALADMAGLVDEAQGARDGLRACAVLNAADPGSSSDNADAAAALADFPRIALIDAPLRLRKAFANAVGSGLSVDELTPRDPKACEELAQLVRNVFTIA